MPELNTKTMRWQRYEPDLPGNREAEKPFYFELAASLTKEQLRALERVFEDAPSVPDVEGETREQLLERERVEAVKLEAEALAPFVKIGPEPITFDGAQATTLEQYLDIMTRFASLGHFLEPRTALFRTNSVAGLETFFSERLSGGFVSTRNPRGGRARGQRANP